MKLSLLILMICSLICGCECSFQSKGHVFDAVTNYPIDSATVLLFVDGYQSVPCYSDTNGLFAAHSPIAGPCRTSRKLKLTIKKKGYKDTTVALEHKKSNVNEVIIYLNK